MRGGCHTPLHGDRGSCAQDPSGLCPVCLLIRLCISVPYSNLNIKYNIFLGAAGTPKFTAQLDRSVGSLGTQNTLLASEVWAHALESMQCDGSPGTQSQNWTGLLDTQTVSDSQRTRKSGVPRHCPFMRKSWERPRVFLCVVLSVNYLAKVL